MRNDKLINQLLGVFCVTASMYGILKIKREQKVSDINVTEKEKKIIAYHEAGHTVAACLVLTQNKVQEVSIIPKADAKGYTKLEMKSDEHNMTKKEIEERIMFVLAGRVAEKIVFDDISTASRLDLKMATSMATNMVTIYGMDDEIGPISFYTDNEQAIDFLGTAILDKVDLRIQTILKKLEMETIKILKINRELLEKIAEELLQKEFLSGEEVQQIINNYK